jgi:hypothetical protein
MVVSDECTEFRGDAGCGREVDRIQRAQNFRADPHRRRSDRVDRQQIQAGEDTLRERHGMRAKPVRNARHFDGGEQTRHASRPAHQFTPQRCGLSLHGNQLDECRRVQIRDVRATARHVPPRHPAEDRAPDPEPPSPEPPPRGSAARPRADRCPPPERSARRDDAESAAQGETDSQPRPTVCRSCTSRSPPRVERQVPEQRPLSSRTQGGLRPRPAARGSLRSPCSPAHTRTTSSASATARRPAPQRTTGPP